MAVLTDNTETYNINIEMLWYAICEGDLEALADELKIFKLNNESNVEEENRCKHFSTIQK